MIFKGISEVFKLTNEEQYETIGRFWDEMEQIYGLENLRGLGYKWQGDEIYYAIGLKDGEIANCNLVIDLPDDGWTTVIGETDCLKEIYDEIYKNGRLTYEIETFCEDGSCSISYYRK
jgi:predicted transcriptional regulator YdeE